jgi:hypothetical protein
MFNYFNIHDYYFLLSQQNRKKSIYLSIYIGCNDLSLSFSLVKYLLLLRYELCYRVLPAYFLRAQSVCLHEITLNKSQYPSQSQSHKKKIYMILSTYYRFNNRFFIKHNISYIMMTICVTC